MTLKIRSMSPKSNQLVPPSQQCIYASLVKIHPLVQKITHETLFRTFQSAVGTLKIRSMSPKSNQLVPPSQQCIYASLVKIHPLRTETKPTLTPTPTGSAPKTIYFKRALSVRMSVGLEPPRPLPPEALIKI